MFQVFVTSKKIWNLIQDYFFVKQRSENSFFGILTNFLSTFLEEITLFPVRQSPGIDIIGVGLKSGEILLHNLKHDETMMKFYQDWGCVTSLSFRSGSVI